MSSPPVIAVGKLARGDCVQGLLMVDKANFKQTRNRKPFLQLLLRDKKRRIKALKWEADRQLYKALRVGDILYVKGRVEEYQGNRQLMIDELERVKGEEVPVDAFLSKTASDVEEMWRELLAHAESVERPELRELLLKFLNDEEIAARLKTWPAGRSLHHAYRGGLLEHIIKIISSARSLQNTWPQLDSGLVTAGAILHDIGKIRELSCNRDIQYTDEGQLIGHVAIGIQMLREKASEIPRFPDELLLEIQHLLVSHHGKAEFGAMREPMTAEAIALHFLDNMDARLSTYFLLAQDQEPGPYGRNWTEYNSLLGTRLFRPERFRDD